MTFDQFLLRLGMFFSRIQAFFSRKEPLHTASFARLHELGGLLSITLNGSSLLLARSRFAHVLQISQTPMRRELGNLLVVARTRGGKGLLATAQLLAWKHSVVVNDIKGELFAQTAGFRRTLGPVYCLDPTGIGHRYDPLAGRESEDKLYASAKHLLFEPHEGDGIIFTQRATKMLTQLFLAAREENQRPLPYVRQMIRLGLKGVANRLQAISPFLAIGCRLRTRPRR